MKEILKKSKQIEHLIQESQRSKRDGKEFEAMTSRKRVNFERLRNETKELISGHFKKEIELREGVINKMQAEL